jgi:hypothetical protein
MYTLPADEQQMLEWEQMNTIVWDIAGGGSTVQYLAKNFWSSYST